MIDLTYFKAEHFKAVESREPTAKWIGKLISDEMLLKLEKLPYSRSFIDEEGKVVACIGVIEQWENNAVAWAVLDQASMKKHMLSIHRWVESFLATLPIDRIEAVVDETFEAGHRWIKLLKFEEEAPVLKKYFPNGASGKLYARVK